MLLFRSKEHILSEELPSNASYLIKRVIQVINPMTSFNKTCYDSGLKFEDFEKAVQALVYWGLGTLINPI
jgi:hypothetical protein